MQIKKTTDTRTFAQIWLSWSRREHSIFYDTVEGVRDSSIRNYITGRRTPTGPSLACLVRGLKRMGLSVGDGRFLFPDKK